MQQIIILAVQLVLCIAGFLIGKFVVPKYGTQITAAIEFISNWASKYIKYAAQYIDASGSEKMNYVCDKLKDIAEDYHINLTDDQIKAIIQEVYDSIKDGEETN